MTQDERPLLCWKCGADIEAVPRPFSRFAECPACKRDLHVCRMCRHFDPKYIGQCSHDFADKVLVKDKSNFCGHFRPDPDAYQGREDSRKEQAQQELHSLFDEGGETEEQTEDESSESDAARKRLDDLFGDF